MYSHSADEVGHVLFDPELGERRTVSAVFERTSPFMLDIGRESRVTCLYFADVPASAWVRETLGSPRWFGDDLGLVEPGWVSLRSLSSSSAGTASRSLAASLPPAAADPLPPHSPVVSDEEGAVVQVAFGSRGWFRRLDPATAIMSAGS